MQLLYELQPQKFLERSSYKNMSQKPLFSIVSWTKIVFFLISKYHLTNK